MRKRCQTFFTFEIYTIINALIKVIKTMFSYRSFVDPVVISVEFGRENHSSILRNYDQKETETT